MLCTFIAAEARPTSQSTLRGLEAGPVSQDVQGIEQYRTAQGAGPVMLHAGAVPLC
jgi:hypothetical protein